MRGRIAGLLVAWTLLIAPSAWAQHPQERKGFWIGFGFGYGSASASCDDCEGGEREGSLASSLRLGGTLNDRVLLGTEMNLWMKEDDIEDVTLWLGSITGTVTFYPKAGGFFLKGGAGWAFVDQDFRVGTLAVTASKSGWGVLAGIGYDIRVGSNTSLSPCVNFTYGSVGDIGFEDGATLGGWKHNVISVELGVTFH